MTREQRGKVELVRSSKGYIGDFESTEEASCLSRLQSHDLGTLRGGAVGAVLLGVPLKRKWVIQDLDGRWFEVILSAAVS